MATYVLVHGGGHGGCCCQRVARILRQAGHDGYTRTLTGFGVRAHLLSPDIDLDFRIHDVILLGHSYGDMVITGVADRATGRVVHRDASAPVNGQSLADVAARSMTAARSESRVIDGVEFVLFPGTGPMLHYGVSDPDDIAWLEPQLTPHPYKCFDQPLRSEDHAELWEIPQNHTGCTATCPHRDPARRERALAAGRLQDIDTGHDLMITEPKAVADLLLRVPTA